jgi:hypothetical protein
MTKRIRPKTNYRKIYEQHYGPIPVDEDGRRYDIHHIDGDHSNNDPANLMAVTIQGHYDIHYSQGDWGACLAIAMRFQITPEEKSNNAKKAARARVEAGIHNWQGANCPVHARVASGIQQEMTQRMNQRRIADGSHNFLGDKNPVHERIKSGIHQEQSKKEQKRRVEDGTHNWLGDKSPVHKRVADGTQQLMCRENAIRRVKEGTHNFLGGEISRRTQRRLLSEGRHITQQVKTCPHCGKTGKSQSMNYWHFDNCKNLTGYSSRVVDETHPSQATRTCPHCGKTGKGNGMIGYHFDNCKKKQG